MGFHEDDRIRQKNLKYFKSKALELVDSLKKEGLSTEEAIDKLEKTDSKEFNEEVHDLALIYLKHQLKEQ